MAIIDWIIILIFFCVLVGLGMKFSKKNKNMEDYFLGGRSMPAWLVVLAASGTSISAGTFVGSPELGFNTNLTYLLFNVGGIIGGLAAALFVLPKLYASKTITIYGFIGDRFNENAKRSTSIMFLIGQLFTSGSRLFIAALAMSVMIFGGINFQFIVYTIIILGAVSTIYTMLGGIKGLIYIDALQMVIICLSGLAAIALIILGLNKAGIDFSGVVDTLKHGQIKSAGAWVDSNKLKVFDTSLSLSTPYNLIGIFIACSVFHFAKYTTDHEFVQRQLTCKSLKGAAKSLVWSQAFNIPVVAVFMGIGMLLYVLYANSDPAAFEAFRADGRDLFPQFIRNSVPMGLRGFMVVGLLAAALSSYNSAINAMASSFTADIVLPIQIKRGKATASDADSISSSKKMVIVMGIVLTTFAIFTAFMQQSSGLNLVDFSTGVMAFAYSGMVGVFCCAIFTKRGNAASIVAALVCGFVVVLLCQPYVLAPLSKAICGESVSLAWPWWTVFGGLVSFLVCICGKKKEA